MTLVIYRLETKIRLLWGPLEGRTKEREGVTYLEVFLVFQAMSAKRPPASYLILTLMRVEHQGIQSPQR